CACWPGKMWPMQAGSSGYPHRIVCLTGETTETLYLLEEEWRIVGISGFTVRPARARREKPRIAAFTSADLSAILDPEPDLVLGFADLLSAFAAVLIGGGVAVHVCNERSVADVLQVVRVLGGIVGCAVRAERLCERLRASIEQVRSSAGSLNHRPKVYFEE